MVFSERERERKGASGRTKWHFDCMFPGGRNNVRVQWWGLGSNEGCMNTVRRQSHSLGLPARRDLSQLGPGVVGRVDAVETHVHGQHVEQLICGMEDRDTASVQQKHNMEKKYIFPSLFQDCSLSFIPNSRH